MPDDEAPAPGADDSAVPPRSPAEPVTSPADVPPPPSQPPDPVSARPSAAPGGGTPSRRRVLLRRGVTVLATIIVWYLSVLLVVNLILSPLFVNSAGAGVAQALFPRFGSGGAQLDQASINQLWALVQNDYVYRNVPGSLGTKGAENGIALQLEQAYNDPFTEFFTTSETSSLNNQLNGVLNGGIGIQLSTGCGNSPACATGEAPNDVVIAAVLRNQPAEAAGVQAGDILMAVDGTKVSSLGGTPAQQIAGVQSHIEGKPGTSVTLEVQRGGKNLSLTVTRQDLTIPSVFTQRFGSVLYVQITEFDSNTGNQLKQALQGHLSGVTGIVLDLRGNPGGYVESAQAVVSQFVAPSSTRKEVVVQRGRMTVSGGPSSAQTVHDYPLNAGGLATNPAIKMAVLVDGSSASAAEITSLALRDYGRATLVGERTYGKGTVQETINLPDGNAIHLSIGKWYGPDGENVDHIGITPEHVVPLAAPGDRYRLDIVSGAPGADAQLQAALALVGGS